MVDSSVFREVVSVLTEDHSSKWFLRHKHWPVVGPLKKLVHPPKNYSFRVAFGNCPSAIPEDRPNTVPFQQVSSITSDQMKKILLITIVALALIIYAKATRESPDELVDDAERDEEKHKKNSEDIFEEDPVRSL